MKKNRILQPLAALVLSIILVGISNTLRMNIRERIRENQPRRPITMADFEHQFVDTGYRQGSAGDNFFV